jgi:hypothetical protein
MQDEIVAWFTGRLPADWTTSPVEVEMDRDEILVTLPLADPELAEGATEESRQTARQARIEGFREDSRGQRMTIAHEAQRRFRRRVSWGARVVDQKMRFTTFSAPAMTRLRMPERKVLDTLIAGGVARSRAEALKWCVRLVGRHSEEWLSELREAMEAVDKVRRQGPA